MEAGAIVTWWGQVLLGVGVVGGVTLACWLMVRSLIRSGPEVGVLEQQRPTVFRAVPSTDPPNPAAPSFVVVARLVGGMVDGEEVEVPSQLWLDRPPSILQVTVVDHTTLPPQRHVLLYRVDPEDSQVFRFAEAVPAPHEMMGDE